MWNQLCNWRLCSGDAWPLFIYQLLHANIHRDSSACARPPRPDASSCPPANDFCTFCSGSLLHLSPHIGPCVSGSVDDGGISSRGRVLLWATSESSLFREIQLAICNNPPIPAPHPSTHLWSCCLRLGRYLKSIFLANQLFLPPLRFFWLFFPLWLRQLQVLQRRHLKLASSVAFNWTGDQEDIWDMIAVAWPRCPWELMTRLVTGSMRVWLFLSKHQDLQFGRINYCSAQKLNCCWFSPTPLRFSLPSAWSLFPHCLLRKTPLFSKCLVKWQSGRRRQLKSLSRCDSERWITEHLVTIDGSETAKKEKNSRESWNRFGEHRNWIGRITTWKRSMHFSGCGEFDKTTVTTTTPLSHTLTHPLQSSPPRPHFFFPTPRGLRAPTWLGSEGWSPQAGMHGSDLTGEDSLSQVNPGVSSCKAWGESSAGSTWAGGEGDGGGGWGGQRSPLLQQSSWWIAVCTDKTRANSEGFRACCLKMQWLD